jgi:hypothetical protein
MGFNATFNNISIILWWSVLLVEETGENHPPAANDRQTLSHKVVLSTPRLYGIRTHNVSDDVAENIQTEFFPECFNVAYNGSKFHCISVNGEKRIFVCVFIC